MFPQEEKLSPYHRPRCPGPPQSLYTPPSQRALGRASWFSCGAPTCDIHSQDSGHLELEEVWSPPSLPAPSRARIRTQAWVLGQLSYHHNTLVMWFYSLLSWEPVSSPVFVSSVVKGLTATVLQPASNRSGVHQAAPQLWQEGNLDFYSRTFTAEVSWEVIPLLLHPLL